MASGVSEECKNAALLQEKEDGEISLEDVSSSDEGHVNNYSCNIRSPQCAGCMSLQNCGMWCTSSSRMCHCKNQSRRGETHLISQDAVQGKENWHHIKDSACTGIKHTSSTLQEKNDDLLSISSDSDMEIIGLVDNSRHIVLHSTSKSRSEGKRKKKWGHSSVLQLEDLVSPSSADANIVECMAPMSRDNVGTKESHLPRSHRRDLSPIRRNKARVLPRTPSRRHRSPIRGHSFKRYRAPIAHSRSPRRVRSVRRSPYRSPVRTVSRKVLDSEQSPPHTYVDKYGNVTKLLKRVKHLDSIGVHSLHTSINRNKENASSLKEKLFKMMKELSDNNGNVTSYSKEKPSSQMKETNDADDEEDLALLRQQALETKQKKSSNVNTLPNTESEKKSNENVDDQDDQDMMRLRIIALRSAVLKKHQNRIRKGMKTGMNKKPSASRSESPFSESFLDSIPIPGDECGNSSCSPSSLCPNDNNQAEDMEKLPYSPTDKITSNILIDTELLGIQSSDVSYMSFPEASANLAFDSAHEKDTEESPQSLAGIQPCTPETPSSGIPYSPSNPINTPKYTELRKACTFVSTPLVSDISSDRPMVAQECNSTCTGSYNTSTPEVPYSPTDTPIYDPDLPQSIPQGKNTGTPLATNDSQKTLDVTHVSDSCDNAEQQNHTFARLPCKPSNDGDNVQETSSCNEADSTSLRARVGSAASSLNVSTSPNSSMITIDDLSETDVDISPRISGTKHFSDIPSIPEDLSSEIRNMAKEPFHMQAVPDMTKDSNKIPTLINRVFVPVPILKSNKQLQQPFPARKQENPTEPAFKSAEMQPATVDTMFHMNKSSTLFKPIQLVPVAKKTSSVLSTPTVFNSCLNEDQESDVSESQNNSLVGNVNRRLSSLRSNNIILHHKRRKRTKKSTKWKRANASAIKNKNNHAATKRVNVKIKANPCTPNLENLTQSLNIPPSQDVLKADETCFHQEKSLDKSSEKKENTLKYVQNNRGTESSDTGVTSIENTIAIAQDADQTKEIEKRRQSVDEDEEALRAILLASLTKRSKSSDAASNVTTHVNPKPAITETKTAVATPALPKEMEKTKINTISKPNTEAALSHLRAPLNANTSGLHQSLSSNTILTSGLTTSFQNRKRHLPIVKGPPRKIIRKVSIPASTKVVNNAKKYQNTIIQRKLNQRKVASRYNIQKISENKCLPSTTNNEKKWTAPSKSLIVPENQRIVINLESDTESDSESEKRKNQTPSTSNSTTPTNRPPLLIPTTEFEKSVDQFLREARKKQESIAAKPSVTPNPVLASQCLRKKSISPVMSIGNKDPSLRTPLAVRHLSASQQEEYRRLKQQILEHEKLKLRRSAENTLAKQKSQPTAPTSVIHPTGISTTETPVNLPKHTLPTNPNPNLTKSFKNTYPKTLQLVNASTPKPVNTEQLNDKFADTRKLNTKQISPLSTAPNETRKAMTNLSVRISNETACFPNTSHAKAVGTPANTGTVSQGIFSDSTVSLDDANKSSGGLKILTKNELNRKFVQVYVNQESKRRVVMINDTGVSNTRNQVTTVVENDAITGINTDYGDMDNVAQVQGNQITPNDEVRDYNDTTIDSDASTQLLSPVSLRIRSTDTVDTTESTLTLSQYQTAKDEYLNEGNNNCDLQCDMILNNRHSIKNNWETIRQDTKVELNILINLPEEEQEQQLANMEQKLVKERYTILNDLAKMVGTLRQWDMERDFQTELVAEVKKLREQLKVAEKKLQEQRNLIKDMGPKVITAHKKINDGRRECCKLSKICSVLGTKVKGEGYKVPGTGAQLLIDGLKDVANHTRQLSKKKVPSLNIPDIYLPPASTESLSPQTVRTESIQTDQSLMQAASNCTISILSQEDEYQDNSCLTAKADNSLQLCATINDEAVVELNGGENKQSDSSEKSDINEPNEIAIGTRWQSSEMNAGKQKERDIEMLCRETQGSVKNNVPVTESSPVERTKQDVEHQPKKIIEPYVSILKHLEVPRNLNPNGVLCPYELMGTCNDMDCQFIHQSKHVQ